MSKFTSYFKRITLENNKPRGRLSVSVYKSIWQRRIWEGWGYRGRSPRAVVFFRGGIISHGQSFVSKQLWSYDIKKKKTVYLVYDIIFNGGGERDEKT